jgi:hypothetical protein
MSEDATQQTSKEGKEEKKIEVSSEANMFIQTMQAVAVVTDKARFGEYGNVTLVVGGVRPFKIVIQASSAKEEGKE